MKPALTAYLRQRPDVRAVFVGTRRTDPHGADLTFFDETDAGWPRFMRVHPVIDWHYREVWGVSLHFLILNTGSFLGCTNVLRGKGMYDI